MTSPESWLLWQLADSAFPAGGFAHSGGLEAAWRLGEVRTRKQLDEFIQSSLVQCGYGALPLLGQTHRDPACLVEVDALAEAFLTNPVANRASRAQGRAFLAASERAFACDAVSRIRKQIQDDSIMGHFAPGFGVVMRLLEISIENAQRLFLFLVLRGGVTGAVRLGILGPLEAQALQFRLAPCAEDVLRRCGHLPLSALAQTAPVLDLLHAWRHAEHREHSH
jgi:urease accessory protein